MPASRVILLPASWVILPPFLTSPQKKCHPKQNPRSEESLFHLNTRKKIRVQPPNAQTPPLESKITASILLVFMPADRPNGISLLYVRHPNPRKEKLPLPVENSRPPPISHFDTPYRRGSLAPCLRFPLSPRRVGRGVPLRRGTIHRARRVREQPPGFLSSLISPSGTPHSGVACGSLGSPCRCSAVPSGRHLGSHHQKITKKCHPERSEGPASLSGSPQKKRRDPKAAPHTNPAISPSP